MSPLSLKYGRLFILPVSAFVLSAAAPTTGNTAEKDELSSALQGYWKGYSKQNCFNPAGKVAELNIYARVQNNRFDFEIRPYSSDTGDLTPYKGTGHINQKGRLTFAKPFNLDDKILVSFQQKPQQISVKSATQKNCVINLRKTAFATLPDYFKGEQAIEDKSAQPAKKVAKKPAPKTEKPSTVGQPPVPRKKTTTATTTNVTRIEGSWTGKGGYGCLYINGRPIEPQIVTNIQQRTVDVAISYNNPESGDQTLYQGQHTLSANGSVAIEQVHPEVGKTQISINKQHKLVFAKLGSSCEIQLSKGAQVPAGSVTASFRKVTDPIALRPKQQALSQPQPLSQSQPQPQGLSLKEQKRFKGYWAGYAGTGCIYSTGGVPMSVDIGMLVEKNRFKLLIDFDTTWGKSSLPFKAEVNIPASKKAVFKNHRSGENFAVVHFKPQADRIDVQMQNGCTIALKRTFRITVPADFVPNRTEPDRKAKIKTEYTNPGLTEKEQKRYTGYWAGFKGTGCIHTVSSWPASVTANGKMEKDQFFLQVSYNSVWTTIYHPLKLKSIVPENKKLVMRNPQLGSTNILEIDFNTLPHAITLIFDRDCRVEMKPTSLIAVPEDFKPQYIHTDAGSSYIRKADS